MVSPSAPMIIVGTRTWLVQHLALGWFPRIPDRAQARLEVEQIRLLTGQDVRSLFPRASIHPERVAGLTVGFVAYAGWEK